LYVSKDVFLLLETKVEVNILYFKTIEKLILDSF